MRLVGEASPEDHLNLYIGLLRESDSDKGEA
jgi:hypothetical protein